MTRLPLITTALLALTACADIPVSSTAGPGAQPAQPEMAARIFFDACIAPMPTYANSVSALAKYPFTQSSTFGTYYHDQQNLSVKLIGTPTSRCSIVFGVSGDAGQGAARFVESITAIGPKAGTDVKLRRSVGPDGASYINAYTQKPQ